MEILTDTKNAGITKLKIIRNRFIYINRREIKQYSQRPLFLFSMIIAPLLVIFFFTTLMMKGLPPDCPPPSWMKTRPMSLALYSACSTGSRRRMSNMYFTISTMRAKPCRKERSMHSSTSPKV